MEKGRDVMRQHGRVILIWDGASGKMDACDISQKMELGK
jgi:hypothetical protein